MLHISPPHLVGGITTPCSLTASACCLATSPGSLTGIMCHPGIHSHLHSQLASTFCWSTFCCQC